MDQSLGFNSRRKKPMADWNNLSNRLFERVIAALALAILAPVLLLIALTLKFEGRGPILSNQKQYGFNNERIGVLRFRSISSDRNAPASSPDAGNTPRETQVSRFIFKTGLAELPQLINVAKGKLSMPIAY